MSLAWGYQTSHETALSAMQILVTLGLRKSVGRKRGFKVLFFLQSHCISKKRLSTAHFSKEPEQVCVQKGRAWQMHVFPTRSANHTETPARAPVRCHFLGILTPRSMWASAMSDTQLHLHPFCQLQGSGSSPAQSSSENRAQTPAYRRKSFKLGTGGVCQV